MVSPINRLRAIFKEMGSVLVAFSGGVDSAVVLKISHEELGASAVAFTAISPTFPPEEQEQARKLTQDLGIKHFLVDSFELEREGYVQNKGDRCYFCKDELFELAQQKAKSNGYAWVADGTILNDLGDHRPGLKAATEHAIRHPLLEAGFDKALVRQVALDLGLPTWNKPSFACLGSRFPVGTKVTLERLQQVQKIESFLRLIGVHQFRARWHQLENKPMLRLEVDPKDMPLLLQNEIREALIDLAKELDFHWVTLDLKGYRSFS
ncbi:MAG: ATP-dependent sacrificial sulfur transferase LarE [Myxococcota bacterium]|nr:ATP-dependent sacrificial sulfur transferase LarE [Myxococcota bacterium]